MKRTLTSLIVAAGFLAGAGAAQAAVSVSIGQPGFFGHLDLGGAPPPALIYERPIVAGPAVAGAPLYLRVPPGHERNWSRHCAAYGACGRQVYFVQDRWYRDTYVPHYHAHHGPPPGYATREERREDRREERRDRERREEWRERNGR